MGATPDKIRRSLLREMDAFYEQGLFTNGLSTIQADELHSYEEGIDVLGQSMLLDHGSPKQLERAMETAAATERITGVNKAGHRHIRSSYFSGTTIATEGVWGWSKARRTSLLHPSIALVDFNGSPRVKKWLLELADGLLAHDKPDGAGREGRAADGRVRHRQGPARPVGARVAAAVGGVPLDRRSQVPPAVPRRGPARACRRSAPTRST